MVARGDHRRLIGRIAAIGAIVAGAVLFGLFVWAWPRWDWLVDFRNYEAGAQRWLAGEPLYAPWQWAPYLLTRVSPAEGFVYSPAFAIMMVPFIGLPIVFLVAVNGALAAVLFVMLRRVLSVEWSIAAIVWIAAATPGWLEAIHYGQVTPLVAAALGLAWLRPRTAGPAGAVLGFTKVMPAAIGIRDIRRLLLVGIPIGLVALALTGVPAWIDWAGALVNARGACTHSLASFGCAGVPWLGYLVAAGLIIAARRSARAWPALVAAAMLAASPEIPRHYALLGIVGALATAVELRSWVFTWCLVWFLASSIQTVDPLAGAVYATVVVGGAWVVAGLGEADPVEVGLARVRRVVRIHVQPDVRHREARVEAGRD